MPVGYFALGNIILLAVGIGQLGRGKRPLGIAAVATSAVASAVGSLVWNWGIGLAFCAALVLAGAARVSRTHDRAALGLVALGIFMLFGSVAALNPDGFAP